MVSKFTRPSSRDFVVPAASIQNCYLILVGFYTVEKIKSNCIIPSAAFSVPKLQIRYIDPMLQQAPEVSDLLFGEVSELGHHRLLKSRLGRMYTINIGIRAVFGENAEGRVQPEAGCNIGTLLQFAAGYSREQQLHGPAYPAERGKGLPETVQHYRVI
jgi:hypothetical protein